MSVFEKDGHKFVDGMCIRCGRRLQHYIESERSLLEWESEAPIGTIATMLCDRIIAKPSTESDFIALVGWGTYYRRQHFPKVKLVEIPEQVYYLTSSGSDTIMKKHYYNDVRKEYITMGE